MNIKLNKKFIKIVVAALALITANATVAPTTITNLTTVSAKAKKHHKKVKKTKKSKKKAYVIAKYYDEFKPGYSYTYNKKKGVFIGHKMKKHHASTTDSDEPRVEKATSNYNVPKVKKFTKDIIADYSLEKYRWLKTDITVNIQDLTNEQQQIAKDAIEQINNLKIVNLTITTKKANITIVQTEKDRTALANTHLEGTGDTYKNLNITETATIELYNPSLNRNAKGNYELKLNQVIIHELGHALGLEHTTNNETNIMNAVQHIDYNNLIDPTHVAIDQNYTNALAVIYQN